MKQSTFTILILISFILGIALFEQNFYSIKEFFLISQLLIVLTVMIILLPLLKILRILKIFKILPLSTFLILGFSLAQHHHHIPSAQTIDHYASEEGSFVTLQGRISEEPDIRRDKINYTVEVSNIKNQIPPVSSLKPLTSSFQPISGTILIQTSKYPVRKYNDPIQISGNLQIPTSFDGFDYAGYLSRYGIYAVMYRPRIEEFKEHKEYNEFKEEKSHQPSASSLKPQASSLWQTFYQQLLRLKSSFESQMNRTFSTEPSSSFMAGLLLGSRKGIPEKLSEAFRITGLTHIIAISGYNITLIASILMAFFRPLGKRKSIILAAAGITLFTLFAGASAAVVRACIMGLISLFALHSERKGDITITLLISAAIMIGYNPKILFHDVGFQLSFLATMGLIYVSPLIEPYFQWLPERLAIRESILLTLSAQIMALPIILFNFQALSVVSPLSNLLIAGPVLPLAMLFGFLAVMTSYISIAIAKLVAFPAYLLLQYVSKITVLTSKIPYASVEVNWFKSPLFIGYFILLSLWLLWTWKHRHRQSLNIQQLKLRFHENIHYQIRQHFIEKGV
jgi:competence protein ComEC